jgi:hypothetical protein
MAPFSGYPDLKYPSDAAKSVTCQVGVVQQGDWQNYYFRNNRKTRTKEIAPEKNEHHDNPHLVDT